MGFLPRSADEGEKALGELGLVADIVPASDGEFDVLVIDCINERSSVG